jgi:C4-dicarboxylate transporter DctQ subunit
MSKDTVFALYTGIKKVNLVCASVAGLILLFVNGSIFFDVFFRYFYKSPSIWITEISTYLFLFIIFLATPYALQRGQHIRVTFLRFRLKPPATRVLDLVCSLLAMTFCAVLLWQTSRMTWKAFAEKWVSPTLLSAPLAYVYIVMVVGTVLLLATFLLRTILEFRGQSLDKDRGEDQ